MLFRLLADATVLLHLAFVVFVVCGGLLVRRWPGVAWVHVPAAAWGAWVELAGWTCPLTPLENWLRSEGGGATYTTSFVEHHLLPILYPASLSRPVQWALGAGVIAINAAIYGLALRRRAGRSGQPSLRPTLGLLGVSFALHEAEEWNIVAWERAHFTPPPQFDDAGARTLLVLFALVGLSFTALCIRFLGTRGALVALLPFFVAVALGNALTHLFWTFYFGTYAPGVVTSALLLVPLTLYLVHRVWRERLVSRAYVAVLLGLALVQPLGAAAAGASLSTPQLALQRLGMRLAQWLWGSP